MVKLSCYWLTLVLVAISEAQDAEESTAVATSGGELSECDKKVRKYLRN